MNTDVLHAYCRIIIERGGNIAAMTPYIEDILELIPALDRGAAFRLAGRAQRDDWTPEQLAYAYSHGQVPLADDGIPV